MPRKLRIMALDIPSMTITRSALWADQLVYIVVANKRIPYDGESSRIAYIGTTKNGIFRIAQSGAWRATELLKKHGITKLDFHIITCSPRQAVKTWEKLEHALLIRFRERFGEQPLGNVHGKRLRWDDEMYYFTRDGLENVLDRYS
jgi:hypothetical protein